MRKGVVFLMVCALATGCTWVKPIEQAEMVSVAEAAADVASCKQLGSASVSVKHKVGFVSRATDKVARELETLARNEAARMGGNRILEKSAPNEGQQQFTVYQCP